MFGCVTPDELVRGVCKSIVSDEDNKCSGNRRCESSTSDLGKCFCRGGVGRTPADAQDHAQFTIESLRV